MLGALGGVTVVTMLVTFRRWPGFVPVMWAVYVALAAAYTFGLL